jgi:hypothetical protein
MQDGIWLTDILRHAKPAAAGPEDRAKAHHPCGSMESSVCILLWWWVLAKPVNVSQSKSATSLKRLTQQHQAALTACDIKADPPDAAP